MMTAPTIAMPPYLHLISVPTPFPVGPVNLYLAEGDPLTLLDTGPRFEPARRALHEGLEKLGYSPASLGRIILSHTHSDHCGLAAELAAASGAEVLTHPANFPYLADYGAARRRRLAFYFALLREAGTPPEIVAQIKEAQRGYGHFTQPLQPDGPLQEGMLITLGNEEWQVLHTPGHAGGLICLYQPRRRLLLSSDHLLRDISSNPIVEPPPQEGAPRPRRLVEYIAQLQRVAQLDIDLALPGHGPPITDPHALIERRLAFHEERVAMILKALSGNPATVYTISLDIFPHLGPIDRFLAVSEVIGHLDWLEAQGKVVSRKEEAVRLWQAV